MTRSRSRRPDCCAVETRALAPLVQSFVDEWQAEHGALRNELGRPNGDEAVGAVTILHERTARVAARVPGGRGISERTIRRVLDGRSHTTELRTADALLTASGQWDALHDGRVPVMPNPRAAPGDRAMCCGGTASLNGSFT